MRKPPKDGVSTGVMAGGTGGRKICETMSEGLSAPFKLHLIFIKMRNMYFAIYRDQATCYSTAIICCMTTRE